MGMFDSLKSSYNLGSWHQPEMRLQTKSLENLLNFYWISPNGELFFVDERPCFEIVPDDSKFGLSWEPTGKNGMVTPVKHYGWVTVYPEKWDGGYETWPETMILFKDGKSVGYCSDSKYKFDNIWNLL